MIDAVRNEKKGKKTQEEEKISDFVAIEGV